MGLVDDKALVIGNEGPLTRRAPQCVCQQVVMVTDLDVDFRGLRFAKQTQEPTPVLTRAIVAASARNIDVLFDVERQARDFVEVDIGTGEQQPFQYFPLRFIMLERDMPPQAVFADIVFLAFADSYGQRRAYDAVYIIKAAMEAAGTTDGSALKDALLSLKYEGIAGTCRVGRFSDRITGIYCLGSIDSIISHESHCMANRDYGTFCECYGQNRAVCHSTFNRDSLNRRCVRQSDSRCVKCGTLRGGRTVQRVVNRRALCGGVKLYTLAIIEGTPAGQRGGRRLSLTAPLTL